jgi:hypothetical protein
MQQLKELNTSPEMSNKEKIEFLQNLGKDLAELEDALSILVQEKKNNEVR